MQVGNLSFQSNVQKFILFTLKCSSVIKTGYAILHKSLQARYLTFKKFRLKSKLVFASFSQDSVTSEPW